MVLKKLCMVPGAMLLIWKNFISGRNKFALVGIIIIGLYCMVTAFLEGAKIDAAYQAYFSGNFAFWFLGLTAFFAWVFVLPAAIFLIDIRRKYSK